VIYNLWIQNKKRKDFNVQVQSESFEQANDTANRMTKHRGWKILGVSLVCVE